MALGWRGRLWRSRHWFASVRASLGWLRRLRAGRRGGHITRHRLQRCFAFLKHSAALTFFVSLIQNTGR